MWHLNSAPAIKHENMITTHSRELKLKYHINVTAGKNTDARWVSVEMWLKCNSQALQFNCWKVVCCCHVTQVEIITSHHIEKTGVKILKFQKSYMASAAILKYWKSPYLGNWLTHRHKIPHGDAVWPLLKFRNFNNPRWRRPPSWIFSERELTLPLAICCRPSVCLSVVCNVRGPYSTSLNFWQCFYAIWYLGHPLTSVENFYGHRPRGIPRPGGG